MKKWYEELFENYAQKYDKESYTQGTVGECDFIETEIDFDKSLKILDVGCETGRDSIELSKRGYAVTGIDLSDSLLTKAKEKAEKQQLTVNFIKHDARQLPYKHEYDVVIMLCEWAFPLMETDEMNYEILQNATKSLKHHGKIIFTTWNGLFPLRHSIEEFFASPTEKGAATCHSNTFHLMTFRNYSTTEIEDDFGNKKELDCNERYYVPSEITWILKSLGYKKIEIFVAKLGAFSRDGTLTTEDFEMLVIAER